MDKHVGTNDSVYTYVTVFHGYEFITLTLDISEYFLKSKSHLSSNK